VTYEARKSDPGDPDGPVSWVPVPARPDGETGPAGETGEDPDGAGWAVDLDRFLGRLFGREPGETGTEPGG
jgi:hypothetical protein